jgi:multiple sugar transport system permease protein
MSEEKATWRMTRRKALGLLGGASAAAVLAACQPTGPQPAEGEGEPVERERQEPPVEPVEEPTEVVVWGKDTTAPGGNRTMIETFNETHDDLQIIAESVPSVAGQTASQMQKILTAIAGGTVPDFFYLDRFLGVEFASRNGILPLDDYIATSDIERSQFIEACWDEGAWQGEQWNIPASEGNIGYWSMAYNREVYEEAGLDPDNPPSTWDETKEFAIKMTQEEGQGYSRIGMIPLHGASWFYQWCWANDASLVSDDNRTITMTQPKVVEALQFLVDFYVDLGGYEKINAMSEGFQGGADDPFITGRIGQVMYGEYQLPGTARYAPDLQLGLTHFPSPNEGDPKVTWVGGWSWALPRGSKQPAAAFDCMQWLAREEGLMAWQAGQAAEAEADGGVWIPLIAAHKETNDLGREEYLPKLREAAPYIADGYEFYYNAPDTYDKMFFRPKVLIASLLWEAQATATQEACYGQKTAEEALSDWEERCQQALDEAWAKLEG